jgi:uncharacterized protein (UPF0261 family)
MPRTVLIAATLDTKAEEALFVRAEIAKDRLSTLLVDCGTIGEVRVQADVSREDIAHRAGVELVELVASGDKGGMIAGMTRGLSVLVDELHRDARIDGIIALGGGQGTANATAAMQGLPLGFPKVMVTTLAGGDLRRFVGTKDIAVFPCVADMLGMNDILRATLGNAAHAVAGMVAAGAAAPRSTAPPDGATVTPPPRTGGARAVVGATALGTTTSGLVKLRTLLSAAQVDIAFFHANGIGGPSMDDLARAGHFDLLLDWSPHELLDLVAGGVFAAPPGRMDVLAERPLPCIVSCGAMDYLVKGPAGELDDALTRRRHLVHNRNITLVRATGDEMARAAALLALKLNRALGPVRVLVPRRGFCEPNAPGKPFHDPESDAAFVRALRSALQPRVEVLELDAHINDDDFIRAAAGVILALLGRSQGKAARR